MSSPTRRTRSIVVINGPIRVANGAMIVKNGTLGGNLDVLLQEGYIAAPPSITTPAATLTIASSVVVVGRNEFTSGGTIGEGTHAIVNHGTMRRVSDSLRVRPATADCARSDVFNDGTLGVGSFGIMRLETSLTNAGRMIAKPGGLFFVAGSLDEHRHDRPERRDGRRSHRRVADRITHESTSSRLQRR